MGPASSPLAPSPPRPPRPLSPSPPRPPRPPLPLAHSSHCFSPLVLSCPVPVLQRQTEHPQHTGPRRSHVPRARQEKRLVAVGSCAGTRLRAAGVRLHCARRGRGVRPPQCPLAWTPGRLRLGAAQEPGSQSWFPMLRPGVHKDRQEVARSMFPTTCVRETP